MVISGFPILYTPSAGGHYILPEHLVFEILSNDAAYNATDSLL